MGCDKIFLNVINIRNVHDENVNIHGRCITSPTLLLGWSFYFEDVHAREKPV